MASLSTFRLPARRGIGLMMSALAKPLGTKWHRAFHDWRLEMPGCFRAFVSGRYDGAEAIMSSARKRHPAADNRHRNGMTSYLKTLMEKWPHCAAHAIAANDVAVKASPPSVSRHQVFFNRDSIFIAMIIRESSKPAVFDGAMKIMHKTPTG